MQDMIKIDAQPARLAVNFNELKEQLQTQLKEYEIVVTAETVGDAKKLATELNKQASALDAKRKEAVAQVSEPIKEADGQMKELVGLYKEGRQKILSQVETFENETRKHCRDMLNKMRAQLWDDCLIDEAHRRAEIEDLIKLSSVTAKGNLTQGACDAVESRIREDEARQNKVKMRLLELENRSYKAGLSAPLTSDHVHQWLEAEEEAYEAQLQRILDAEVEREQQAQARMRQRMERERQEQEAREQAERERQERQSSAAVVDDLNRQEDENDMRTQGGEAPATQPAVSQQQDVPAPQAAPGKVRATVTATFTIEIPPHITDEQLRDDLLAKMRAGGFQSAPEIEVARHKQAA